MAKIHTAILSDSHWVKASELQRQTSEESKFCPLDLPRLKVFFPFGLKRGSLVEITGSKSSGRTSASLYILAESISKGEICACVDLNNQFDPSSLAQSGVALDQLAWVRCQGNAEHAMRSADLLLHAGGFGVVLLDLCGASPKVLNKIPLSYWFRFRRAIEDTPTILIICGEHPQARSCSVHSLHIQAKKFHWSGDAPFSPLIPRPSYACSLLSLEATGMPGKAAHVNKVISIRPESLLIQTALIQSTVV
jgi:hypothetical protein